MQGVAGARPLHADWVHKRCGWQRFLAVSKCALVCSSVEMARSGFSTSTAAARFEASVSYRDFAVAWS